MKRVKLLKRNSKVKFMIVSIIIFSFLYALFGVLVYYSPMVNWKDGGQKASFSSIYTAFNNDYDDGLGTYEKYNSFFNFLLFNQTINSFTFIPTQFTVFYLPLIVGGISLVLMLIRSLIHLVGYKNQTKKGVARIVRPIRSYQITMICVWVTFTILLLASCLTFISASYFVIGIGWEFNTSGIVSSIINSHVRQTLKNYLLNTNGAGFQTIYWPSLVLFYKNFGYGLDESAWMVWIWILVPAIPFLLFGLLAFFGVIVGESSWWTINLAVLRDIDATTGMSIAKEYDYSKPLKIKKEKSIKVKGDIVELQDGKFDTSHAIGYYKSLIKLLEKSKNTNNSMFTKAKEELTRLTNKSNNINWSNVIDNIEDEIDLLTGVEQKFVELIESVINSTKINVFGRYKQDVIDLIKEYNQYIEEWKIFEAESVIEQIFAIAFKREELLAKVGYCLRSRLKNNFKYIDDELETIKKLEVAKIDEDYEEYRKICLEAIEKMSPIKSQFSNYAKKIIYN
ncbi:hypothetical protein SGLAD_v1c05150 [Spiroplasma gladiatoris]|uniref:Uncharacterized protein n=1 Tax=Spiroplasma gladiatoris TaxID=2143 RepID=A0A4P7AH05_9MOLU|nr:hypothetical protein [Spiroplasma gladiatoris]QBQ07714.1 hypothetical protein SGLAD_v1c05150 [Spiroplasma gladiatoris]